MRAYDLAIIGAGPAGMAAALEAAKCGMRVALLDEQQRAGGQIYRDVGRVASLRGDILGADYLKGQELTQALAGAAVDHITGAVVWSVEAGFTLAYTREGVAHQLQAEHLLIATGAIERPMPVDGWTKAGVMTAGAGQILLKQSGIVAHNAILVGSGPLLYLTASQMITAGSPPRAVVETQSRRDFWAALPHLAGALRGWRYLLKGMKMLAALKRAGVPRFTAATQITITGDAQATGVTFVSGGVRTSLTCDVVYLHHGVVPNVQVARSLGVTHHWDEGEACFVPTVDDWGQSDVANVFIAGDGAGIGGAATAALRGRLAALQIAHHMGHHSADDRDKKALPLRKALRQDMAVRPFLNRAYPPYASALTPQDDVIICRCEEVRAGDVRRYAQMGCTGPNQTKAFGRVGMGPCQGRYCGLTVTQILAQCNRQTPDETGYYRIRPPLKPVTLGELAGLQIAERAEDRGADHD